MSKKRKKARQERKKTKKGTRALPLENRPVLLVSLLLAVLLALLFNQLVFGGKVFVSPDAVAPVGFASVAQESMKAGGPYPLWNPYVFFGMPSFGSLTFNPYVYFPDVILTGLHTVLPFLPPMTWLLLYYFLAGLFLFLLLRDGGLSVGAGLFAAVAFMLTPNLVAVGAHGHGSQLITCAFIPIVLLAGARLLSRGDALSFGLLALAAGLQLLRAHVQVVYYTWLALGLYVLLFLLMKSATEATFVFRLRRLAYVALALVVALALASVLYLPVHDYSAFSSRGAAEGGGLEFGRATDWSFSPVETMTFLVPSWLGFGGSTYWGSMPFTDYPNYMGILPLFLAVIGLLGLRRREVLFFVLLALFSLLVSFGKHFEPLYRLFYEYLPYFNKFRVPVMILVLLQFAVAALAAYGVERVHRERDSAGKDTTLRRASLWIAGGFLVVWLVWLVFGDSLGAWYSGLVTDSLKNKAMAAGAMRNFSAGAAAGLAGRCFEMVRKDVLIVALIGLAGFAGVHLFLRRKLSFLVLAAVLVVLTVVDIWRVNTRIFTPMVGEPASVSAEVFRDDTIEFLQRDTTLYRILPLARDFMDNRYAAFGIANVGGYHAAKPMLYEKFYDAVIQPRKLSPAVLAFLNVKYIVAPEYIQPGEMLSLAHDGSKKVYVFRDVLPRAYLVDSVKVFQEEAAVLEEIVSPSFDPSRTALLLESPAAGPVAKEGSSVRITSYGLNEVGIETSIAQTCFLVLSDLYYPNWRVEIDGDPTTIYRTNFLFRGVSVPPGKHEVRFFYHSRSLRAGMFLSASASAVIILSLLPAAVRFFRRGRRSESARHNSDVQ
ncbi:MAG: YfhO family protein [Candidatus Eiseniibacteriota bacterium]|nr:MAG: YfhO family protein [Candidatus Eisenbacteria bacterium]